MGGTFKENQLWPHFVATKVNAIESSGSTVKPALGVLKNSLLCNLKYKLFQIFSWYLNLDKDLDPNYMELNRTNNPKSSACAAERQEFQHMDVMLITYLHTRYASFAGQHSQDCKRKHRAVRGQLGLPCRGQLPL